MKILFLLLPIAILLTQCSNKKVSTQNPECTGKLAYWNVFPDESIIVSTGSLEPYSGWCIFNNKSNSDVLKVNIVNGITKERTQLNPSGDTISYSVYDGTRISLYVKNNSDTIEKTLPLDYNDSSIIRNFADNFTAKKFKFLDSQYTGQIGPLNFEEIISSFINLYGEIQTYSIASVNKSYSAGTSYPSELFFKLRFICPLDTVTTRVLLTTDQESKKYLSISSSPKKTYPSQDLLGREGKISGKQLLLGKTSFDTTGFHKIFFASPLSAENNYEYTFNGTKTWLNGDYLESITVKTSNDLFNIYLLYRLKNSKYTLHTRTIALPQLYQPLWLLTE